MKLSLISPLSASLWLLLGASMALAHPGTGPIGPVIPTADNFHPQAGAFQASSGAGSEATRQRLAEAVSQTGAGNLDAAQALYEQVAAEEPNAGIPALARFLRLAGRTEAAEALAAKLKDGPEDAVVRARGLIALGRNDDAIALLRPVALPEADNDPAAVMLLTRLLRQTGKTDQAETLLARTIQESPRASTRDAAFYMLVARTPEEVSRQPKEFMKVVGAGFEAARLSRAKAEELADRLLIEIQQRSDYFEYRDAYLEAGKAGGAGAAWLGARLLVREERHTEAYEYLTAQTSAMDEKHPFRAFILEARAILARSVGRHDESRALLSTAANLAGGDASSLLLQGAGATIAAGDTAGAHETLAKIDLSKLTDVEREQAIMLRLLTAARLGEPARVVETYADAIDQAREENIEPMHGVIFAIMLETDQHLAIERLARARLDERPGDTSPRLWLLVSAAAKEARRMPNAIEAMYRYVEARPGDFRALRQLGKMIAPVAAELAQAPIEALAITQKDVEVLVGLAEKSLEMLVRALPYDPEYIGLLIKLREAKGDTEGAARVPDDVLGTDIKDVGLLDNIGFALATNGYPEAALVWYDRALKINPDAMKIRMNEAAALTRLSRFDEARAIYASILEDGWRGKPFHSHEFVERIWRLDEHLGQQERCIAYFRELAKRHQGAWREETLSDIGNLLINMGYMKEGAEFHTDLIAETDDLAAKLKLYFGLGHGWMTNKQPEEALKVFAEGRALAGDLPEADIELAFGEARALQAVERNTEAIKTLRELARKYPTEQRALGGLREAGKLAEEKGQADVARELYEEFLASASTDFPARRELENRFGVTRN